MKRSFLLVCLFAYFSFPVFALAETSVPVRITARDDYARLVFGWPENVKYKVDRSDESRVRVTFDHDGEADISALDLSRFPYIAALDIENTKPLTVVLDLSQVDDVRDFKIGKRVIFDVYPSQNVPVQVAEQPKPVPDKTEDQPPSEELSANTLKSDDKQAMPASPPEIVLIPEYLPDSTKTLPEKPKATPVPKEDTVLTSASKDALHTVSLRSTRGFDVAIYKDQGQIWFAIDSDDGFISPRLSSPQESLFTEPVRRPSAEGLLYSMSAPDDLPMKGQGGGLAWNFVMGDTLSLGEPIKPERKVVSATAMRSGTLVFPFRNVGGILKIADEVTGRDLYAVTVGDAEQFAGDALQSYVEFDILPSYAGVVIRPKVDDLSVRIGTDGVEITRPGGIAISTENTMTAAEIFKDRQAYLQKQDRVQAETEEHGAHDDGHGAQESQGLFRFNEWQLGKVTDLKENEIVLLGGLHQKDEAGQVEDLLTLGKMFLAHGRGAEAIGYFNFAGDELPALEESAEFKALRGAARALDWRSEAALEDFLDGGLKEQEDIKYWKSFVLADLGDWQQAAEILPSHFGAIRSYPPYIQNRLALTLAEVKLRDGKIDQAEELMAIADHNAKLLMAPQKAALKYLRGEALRQKNELERAKDLWANLAKGKDDLYRTKAGLALTILRMNEGELNNEQAIDSLERLRYAWRGDELEAQVKYWLGDSYFKDEQFVKGLSIMKDAASIAEDSVLVERITGDMSRTFSNLYLGPKLAEVSAIDAVALYEQFSELTPVGEEGNKVVQMLAEHLVRADLLDRAAKLLEYQVDHRLEGDEKLRVAIRLAAIRLLDKTPQKAIDALIKAEEAKRFVSNEETKARRQREIDLLRIRAYTQNKQYDKALSLIEELPDAKDVNRLKADIAWQAGYWNEAADVLHDVLLDEAITPDDEISKEQAGIILNRSIALALDDDRIALANMRAKYLDQMKETQKAHQFEVITRPRRNAVLADRETLMSAVQEVDLFKDFLEAYRNDQN